MAATLTEFYFDGLNLALSSCVFTDAALTTVAPQGWYSDGSATRFLTVTGVNGSLGVDTNCPSCNSDCSTPIVINIDKFVNPPASPTQLNGTYLVPLGLGIGPATQGAIIIRVFFDESSTPTGESEPISLLAYSETQGTTVYTTNNFTASGTDSPAPVEGEAVNWAGTEGGSIRKINDTPLASSILPVWVGSQTNTSQDANNSCIANTPQLPSNSPFTGTGTPITRTGYPHYTFQYNTGGTDDGFVLTSPPITPDIVVEEQQVQVGNAPSPGNGYRGWITTVIPKDNNIQDTAYLQIQNVLCNGGLYVVMDCATTLLPINCSSPFSNQSDACGANVNSGFQLFNVPGAQGTVQSSGSPTETYEFGLPNLFDLVCSTELGNDLTDELKNKWYKYNNSQGEPRLFHVDEYSVIDQTDVVCVINDIPLDTSFSFSDTEIGGGKFRAQAQIDAGVTGAVIIRAFTGNVAVGLYVNHTDSTGNPSTGLINSTNLFSVRGSSNIDGNLMQTEYVLNSDDTNVEALTGYDTAGASINLNSFNSTAAQSSAFLNENGQIIKQWMIYDYQNPCGTTNQLPCYVDINSNQPGGFFIDAPVYIGKAGESTAAIPCTSTPSDAGGDTFSSSSGPQVDCSSGFNPPTLGNINVNVTGLINLPSNGNHQYLDGELAYPIYLNGNEAQSFNILTAQSEGIYAMFKYPVNTTGCDSCQYTYRILDGDTGNYMNTSTFSSFYLSNRQVQLYSTPNEDKSPGWSMAVLPKTSANIEKILLDVYSVTSNTSFIGYISCAALSSFTAYAATPAELVTWCGSGSSTGAAITVYVAHSAYGGEAGPCIPGATGATGTPCQGSAIVAVNKPYLNDMVFTDANGANKLPQGLYWFSPAIGSHFTMSVDAYGVVTCIRNCTSSPNCS